MYHKSSIEAVEIEKYKSEDIEALWIQVEVSSQKMLFGTVYRPPQQESFHNKFETVLEQIWQERRNIFITGDLNSDMTPNKMNDKGKRLARLLNSFNLNNMIKEATRVTENTKSVIDLMIVSDITKVKASGVHDICIADHKLIYLKLLLQRKKSKPMVATVTDYRKLDVKAYKEDVEAAPWWICSIFDDVDDITWCWQRMYNEIKDSHITKRKAKIRTDSLPWVNSEIRKMMNQRYKLLKKCKGTPKTSREWQDYKRLKNYVTKMMRKAESNYWRKEFQDASCSQDFWKTYKRVTRKNITSKIGPIHDQNGCLVTNDKAKADVLNDFFVSIGQELSEKFTQETEDKCSYISKVTPSTDMLILNEARLRTKLMKINPKKASGPDNVTSKELSLLQDSLLGGLDIVFRSSLNQSTYPRIWKNARVKSAPKKGSKTERTNYRPLSMLSQPSKLLEDQVCDSMDKHLNSNQLKSKNQWGFSEGRSTEGLLLRLTEKWKQSVDQGLIVGIVFIDFQKAFDTVPHDILPQKLLAVGISGDFLSWIMNYLCGRQQYVEVNGVTSETKCIRCGVPQGSLIGPRLFSIYVNDLPSAISEGEIQMFADDTTFFCTDTNIERLIDKMNIAMNEVYLWCQKHKLTIHPGKSEAMIMMKRPLVGPIRPIMIGTNVINVVSEAVCLGVKIDNRLTWEPQINSLCKAFSQKLSALKRMKFLPRPVLEKIYFSTVISKITYCMSVWGNCSTAQFEKLEIIHGRAARMIYNLTRSTSKEEGLSIAQWQPLGYIYKRRIAVLMHTIYNQSKMDLVEFEKLSPRSENSRNLMQLKVDRFKTEVGRNSFRYRGSVLWNALPYELKQTKDQNVFRNKLKSYNKLINDFNFAKGNITISNKKDDYFYF